ncbi:MAG TPA: N-acetyltransferase [Campylobacterales bacterium]|nr:N-acetyltransferase [Campylobacterales bacterium]HHS92551.1 N-acetyltransferase [Campylobacterales bacterium]
MTLETTRLILRQWKSDDFSVFAKMNADQEVMRYFPHTLAEVESNALGEKIESLITQRGWGFWAIEEKSSQSFIGYVGLHEPQSELPFNPCVEVGWRLDKAYWSKGYATQAAHEALRFAFEELGLKRVYSFTALPNYPSMNVMKRLGMVDTKQNFMHPSVDENSPLREHVLYLITQEMWENQLGDKR